jgi:hypothetical protein
MKDLEAKYDQKDWDMVQKMPGKQSVGDDVFRETSLPFMGRVMNFPLPYKFKVPYMTLFDGNRDPKQNLETYRAHIILHETPDKIAYRVSPLTLTNDARDWFWRLPPKLLDSFNNFGKTFLAQFLVGLRCKKPTTYLLTLR